MMAALNSHVEVVKLLLAQQPDASLFCVAPLRTIGNRNTRLRYIVLN